MDKTMIKTVMDLLEKAGIKFIPDNKKFPINFQQMRELIEECKHLLEEKNVLQKTVDIYRTERDLYKNQVTELKTTIKSKGKVSKICPYCKSKKVIMFSSDDDICTDCWKYFPGT